MTKWKVWRVVRLYATFSSTRLHGKRKSLTFVGDTNYWIRQIRYTHDHPRHHFKKLFGTEMNKDLLISFINSLLHGREQIKELTYLNTEHLGTGESDRRAVFDVYCENESGEKVLVAMQRGEQQFFKDRSLYYATFPIREQARRGDWTSCSGCTSSASSTSASTARTLTSTATRCSSVRRTRTRCSTTS